MLGPSDSQTPTNKQPNDAEQYMHTVVAGQCSNRSYSAAERCYEQHHYVSTSDTQCLTHLDRKNVGKDSLAAKLYYFMDLVLKINTLCKVFVVITS